LQAKNSNLLSNQEQLFYNACHCYKFACQMGRILAIDYGKKRCGIAVTDPLGIIANSLDTISTHLLMNFLIKYISAEKVKCIVLGIALNYGYETPEIEKDVLNFIKKLNVKFPDIKIEREDERFTSKLASHTLFAAGATKKQKTDKALIDKISATIILQSYLERINRIK
jgi:putative holliday junction resolvase